MMRRGEADDQVFRGSAQHSDPDRRCPVRLLVAHPSRGGARRPHDAGLLQLEVGAERQPDRGTAMVRRESLAAGLGGVDLRKHPACADPHRLPLAPVRAVLQRWLPWRHEVLPGNPGRSDAGSHRHNGYHGYDCNDRNGCHRGYRLVRADPRPTREVHGVGDRAEPGEVRGDDSG